MADQIVSDACGASVDVSFIMAAHDAAPWIETAIRSALDQAGVAVEILVVDDGSVDGTDAVIARLAAADPRIRAVPLDGARPGAPRGPSCARNAALQAARGRWVAILDADDLVVPDRTRTLLDLAAAAGADILADNPIPFAGAFDPRGAGMLDGGREPYLFEVDLARYLTCNRMLTPGVKLGYLKPMLRADLVRRHGLRYDEGVRVGEDFLFCLGALAGGARFVVTSYAGYGYRRGSASLSHRLRLADIQRLDAAFAAWAGRGVAAEPQAQAADIRQASRAYRDSLATAQVIARVVDAAQAGRWLRGAALALGRPQAWRFLAGSLLSAAGKRLRPAMPDALPVGQR
ncbi:glycosyltransferase family 2 protein [Methylobacterium sp. NEAU K]|uniref:glycosyltransferase family 2 protein n=1 Tax=Methylobacterium sp. NEAU K TaxID=3064946 RepID=UPI0027330A2B|nr:glycosyltransferase family 2 protein [Methylobacterium sp. NEAU K]MDP4006245.1 glycosyltransferase family 2 protein [Methylobacterium sp. NEAU K]